MRDIELYGIKFSPVGAPAVAQKLTSALTLGERVKVFTPNFGIMRAVKDNSEYKSVLLQADLLLTDGAGIGMLCALHGIFGVPRVTGIDTAYFLLRYAEIKGFSVFFLGGKDGVAKKAAKCLMHKMPLLKICGTHHGYFDKSAESAENQAVIRALCKAKPDILFVCMGFPAQERWIIDNFDRLPSVRVAMGIGGSLDVWAGDVRRAPMVFRVLDLEWLWRCMHQPERFAKLLK